MQHAGLADWAHAYHMAQLFHGAPYGTSLPQSLPGYPNSYGIHPALININLPSLWATANGEKTKSDFGSTNFQNDATTVTSKCYLYDTISPRISPTSSSVNDHCKKSSFSIDAILSDSRSSSKLPHETDSNMTTSIMTHPFTTRDNPLRAPFYPYHIDGKMPVINLSKDKIKIGVKNSWQKSKSKRMRTIFSPEQLDKLEQEFQKQQYMVGSERLYLAAALNLSEAQVKVWFQNRRIKWRKQNFEQTRAKLAELRQQQRQGQDESDDDDDSDELSE